MPKVTPHQRHIFTGHSNAVYDFTTGRSAGTVMSASGDGLIAEWSVVEGGDAQLVARVPTQTFSICHLEGHQLVAAGQMEGGIHIMDTQSRQEVRYLKLHEKGVFSLLFDADRQRLYACGGDGVLSVWGVPAFELLFKVHLSENHLRSVALAPDRRTLAVGCSGDAIHILSADNLEVVKQWTAHENSVFSVLFVQEGKKLVSGGRDAYIRVWDVEQDFAPEMAIPAHLLTVNDLKLMCHGRIIASAGRDKQVKLWDASTFALLKVIDHQKGAGHTHSVNRLFWSEESRTMITGGDDRTVQVWEIAVTND